MSTVTRDNFSTQPQEVGRAVVEYPFRMNGDRTTKTIKRTYKQAPGHFTPTPLGSPDAQFPNAYLIEETDPAPTQTNLDAFTRTYSTVPSTQTVSSSIILSRPSLSGSFPQVFGSLRLFQPDTTLLQFDAYAKQSVTSDSGAPLFYATGGTYTITFNGNTTSALNYNDSAATVQTALNALTSVINRGSVVVSGSYNTAGGFLITFNDHAQITLASSLTGGTISSRWSLTNNGYTQNVIAGVEGTKLTITIDTSALTTNGPAASTLIDYEDGGHARVSNISRCAIYSLGYYDITGGSYTITLGSYTTGSIPYDAELPEIQAALDAVGPGLFIAQAWDYPGNGSGGYFFQTTWSIRFSVYFVGGPATGGTYTLTAFSSTTAALAYNADAAAVQTALNAITAVSNRGSVTVTGTLTAGFSIAFANPSFTATSASLTPSPMTSGVSVTDTGIGRLQTLRMTRTTSSRDLYVAGHGIGTGETLFVKGDASYFSGISNYTIPDANTIRINVAAADSFAAVTAITECGKRTKYLYESGSAAIRCKRITDFYLPGITSGITTADDIPLPTNQSDGTALVIALLGGGTTVNVNVGELTAWRGGPILSLTRTVINSADA
jgi:hypothetical protein